MMTKLLTIFFFLLVLLLFPLKNAGKLLPGSFGILTELEEFEIEGDDEDGYDLFDLPSLESLSPINKIVVNVDSFRAVGDGVADDTQAFVNAWNQACKTPNTILLVQEGKSYLVSAIKFNGPCEPNLVVQIDGTIIAPNNPHTWDLKSPRTWLVFNNLTNFKVRGYGVVDGRGDLWWKNSCKRNKTNRCISAPTAFTIESSSVIRVSNLRIQNAPQMNIIIKHSDDVRVKNVTVSAPATSPNTDGIHLTSSTNVLLHNCSIGTGDDCISIVDGCADITMKNINCGPGHGISIGSLGQNNSTGKVERVVLNKAYLNGTTNGLRIKTYQGGSGSVNKVLFRNVQMNNVSNPIIIDQFYCDSKKKCQNQTSAVAISQIVYRNVVGISATQRAMTFSCSDTVPCTNIVLNNISLQNNDATAMTYCHSVSGIIKGDVEPRADCLLTSTKGDLIAHETGAQRFVHTDL